ncbi:MAG: NFACT RNA binding domain-containing protein [Candidatus Krumholzibacteriota bacterium]
MNDSRPWSDPDALATLLAGWRKRWSGRPVFRVSAGRDWLRIGLEGDSRPGILLTNLPAATLVLAQTGRLPGPVVAALPATRNHPLSRLLDSAEFSSCGMFPNDRIAAFRLTRSDGKPVYLLHQLFGARGNTVLLDDQAKLLWSRHRPPHSLLAAVPPAEVWSHGEPGESGNVSDLALQHLTAKLLHLTARENQSRLDRLLKSARRLVENLTRDFDRAEKGDLYRRKAEALAAHLHEIRQGSESVTVDDPRDGEALEIALDPALAPAANMEAWFRRARKADKGRDVIAERLSAARAGLATLEEAGTGLEGLTDADGQPDDQLARLQEWQAAHTDLLQPKTKRSPGGRYGPEEPARPFRRYLVDGRWEVWVGRNNKENDELTHRTSHSRDIWFHAQGVPGSHVILRTAGKPEQIPKTVLAKAASLAALNSRARHSELVPVIYTERKYVRKPRKSPPGTAVCLREKSIFVAPGLAAGVVGV